MQTEIPHMEIKPEDLRKIQLKSLEMLLYFKDICDKNGLLFYFCGGCCIGALRDKGFIPWDDDIDIFMPRRDYERLAEIWPEQADNSRYRYTRTTRDHFTKLIFATISDENTTFIKQRQYDVDTAHGIRLDIFPIDGCPNSRFKRKMQIGWALIYSMFNTREPVTSKGRAAKILSSLLLKLAFTDGLKYRVWTFAQKRMSRFELDKCEKATELCAWWRYMRNEYPAEAFQSAVYEQFEGYMLPLPAGYDQYLKIAFGDYMTPPPEDKRGTGHDLVFYDLDNSYKKYKGIYYCVNDKKEQGNGKK